MWLSSNAYSTTGGARAAAARPAVFIAVEEGPATTPSSPTHPKSSGTTARGPSQAVSRESHPSHHAPTSTSTMTRRSRSIQTGGFTWSSASAAATASTAPAVTRAAAPSAENSPAAATTAA
ncbi:hypothetical protein ACWGI8_07825 [Streptomyces sp. NPDC054841]